MDVKGWRKWLRTPGSIGTPQNQEGGMLKLLLGHWKAHRKKPSLLPEDGDIRFEDPSKFNPIFEDSDSSTSSTKRPTDSIFDENQTVSQVENEQNSNVNNAPAINELTDVFVPTHSKDSVTSDITLPKDEIIDTEGSKSPLITETVSESGNLEKSEASSSFQSEVGDVNLSSLESEGENVKKELESSHESATTNVGSKFDTESLEIKSEEKMRLYNQPSTSAIREGKNSFDNTTHENESTQLFRTSKASVVQNANVQTNKQKVSNENYPHNRENIETSAGQIRASSPTSVQPSESEKPAKLRAKAIAELIKKFQVPITETGNAANDVAKPDKKPSSNQPPKVEEIGNKIQNNKEKNFPNPSQNFQKDINKIVKPQREDIPKTTKSTTENGVTKPINSTTENVVTKPINSTTETVIPKTTKSTTENVIPKPINSTTETVIPKPINSTAETVIPKTTKSTTETVIPKPIKSATDAATPSKNDEEIEALSNIFKFPPPPPLEIKPNESSLHGKIMKDLKFNTPLATSSKSQEITDNLKRNESGKTRLDSSLERTRTASSNKLKENKGKAEMDNNRETTSKTQDALSRETSEEASTRMSPVKGLFLGRIDKESKKSNQTELKTSENKASLPGIEKPERLETTKISEFESQASNSVSTRKQSTVSEPKSEIANSKASHKHHVETHHHAKSPVHKQKSSISKASTKPYSENENVKSHSEDSGITRGDQISSETNHETPIGDQPEEASPAPNPSRKNKKEKKLKSINKKICKNCKHSHGDGASIKRSQYDEYYDGITRARHSHRGKHSDSWTSDLSWEEKELLRRLRGRRGTVRSNTPSTRSRLSKHRYITDQTLFRRHHNLRRSYSDDSTFYASSMCSCDECWSQYVKGYAYGRASLRGMPPIHMCTCQTSRPNFLGRRVKFRSDTIHEVSPSSERTTGSTTPPAESKQEDGAEDPGSQMSSNKAKDGDSVHTNPNGIKGKKSKTVGEAYRFVTPWELEEWDIIMRKQLLQSRRKRARCMGIMALAMVIFIGLVVAILMVYLRRKTL